MAAVVDKNTERGKETMNSALARMRQDIDLIFRAGLSAVEPGAAIKRCCRLDGELLEVGEKTYDLQSFKRIVVLGAGKAGASMAAAIEELLGNRISEGLVVVKYDHVEPLEKIKLVEAAHPVPDEAGVQGATELLQLAESCDAGCLVISLISGGGSALLAAPAEGIAFHEKQQLTQVLLDCGATIHEMNTIRKHLSRVKGGGLAKAVFPATLVNLILSDVVGDDLDSIASGPCVPDSTTFDDCQRILEKYEIQERVPQSIFKFIEAGCRGEVPETPKSGLEIFEKTSNVVIGCNYDALSTAKQKGEALGYNSLLLSSMIEGETKDVAALHMAIAKEVVSHDQPLARPACILSGGETTVTIRGSGKGGRSQEFALACLFNLPEAEDIVLLCAGTDGTDGPTDAAGAMVDSSTMKRSEGLGLLPQKYLENNDSYNFFSPLGDLYKTGPTHTNVMDLRIILIGSPD